MKLKSPQREYANPARRKLQPIWSGWDIPMKLGSGGKSSRGFCEALHGGLSDVSDSSDSSDSSDLSDLSDLTDLSDVPA